MGFRIARVDVVAIVGTDHTNIVTVTDLQQHLVVGVLLFEVVILKFEKNYRSQRWIAAPEQP